LKFQKYKGFKFRSDGKYLAVAGRKDCKDFINIYECNEWSLLKVKNSENQKFKILKI